MFFSSPAWDSLTYWSLDLETGGLDPRRDAILAVGMLPVRQGSVRLGEAYQTLVRPPEGVVIDPGSVQAHQLVQRDVHRAPPIEEVLPEVLRRLGDGVLLLHHQALDLAFLKRAASSLGQRWPSPRVVDTVRLLIMLERRRRRAQPDLPDELPVLNLSKVRRGLGLPDYQAHDALTDALATAELFLVLRSRRGARTLHDLA